MRIGVAGPDFAEDAAVLALLREAFAFMDGRIDPPSSLDRMTVADVAAKRAVEVLLVAREGTRLAGCAFISDRGDHGYLGKLAVAGDLRGRGIARRLVEAAAGSHPVLRLQTRIELVENHATFARLGFREIGRTAHPGFTRPTSITMERRP